MNDTSYRSWTWEQWKDVPYGELSNQPDKMYWYMYRYRLSQGDSKGKAKKFAKYCSGIEEDFITMEEGIKDIHKQGTMVYGDAWDATYNDLKHTHERRRTYP